jgi:hypothetical protein
LEPSDGTVTTAKLADSSVSLAKLTATGTKDATTFLRGDNTFAEAGGKFESQLLHVIDEKPTQTQGGSLTSGTDNVRTLNTVKTNEISGASLSSNAITLTSGTYYLDAKALNYKTASARLTWRNTTDSSNTIIGMMAYNNAGNGASTYNFISGRFTIAGTKVFNLEHRVQTTDANGAGYQDDGFR